MGLLGKLENQIRPFGQEIVDLFPRGGTFLIADFPDVEIALTVHSISNDIGQSVLHGVSPSGMFSFRG
jgi:hypothetical protein